MYNIALKRIEGRRGLTLCYTFTPEVTEIEGGIRLKIAAFRLYTPEGSEADENGKYIAVPAIEEEIIKEEIDKEIMLLIKKEGTYLIERYIGTLDAMPVEIEGLEGDIVLWGVILQAGEISIEYKEVYDGFK